MGITVDEWTVLSAFLVAVANDTAYELGEE